MHLPSCLPPPQAELPRGLHVLAVAVKIAQLLVFPVGAIHWVDGDESAAHKLARPFSVATMLTSTAPAGYVALIAIAMLWVLSFALLLVSAMSGFASHKIPPIAVLALLRFGACNVWGPTSPPTA